MGEYIQKKMTAKDYEQEILRLIRDYNRIMGTYLCIFATDMVKRIPGSELMQEDYYTICDILANVDSDNLDILLETPGGSGSTAEDIVKFIRSKFKEVNFVIPGEAKSAGTILALSGNEIIMPSTGSLGPIDAQVQVGRSRISAFDYVEWVDEKRKEAIKLGKLNPVDAIMIAQISPGEYRGIFHALKYAEDLVKEWLPQYKFKNWTESETRKIPITEEMKQERAREIAEALTQHSSWRDHGRSIKRDDLELVVKLKVKHTEAIPGLDEVVRRLHVAIRLLFGSSQIFKMFFTADHKIFRQAASAEIKPTHLPMPDIKVGNINAKCEKCGKIHKFYVKFQKDRKIDEEQRKKGFRPLPKDGVVICGCGFNINLTGVRNELELGAGKKVVD
ncbi:MAG: hypothetical protein WAW37_19540 [Syntrophobacteraceae bacterium]